MDAPVCAIEASMCIQDKRIFIQIWDLFYGACSHWKELALVMRKCLPFLIIDANSPIDCLQAPKKMSQM